MSCALSSRSSSAASLVASWTRSARRCTRGWWAGGGQAGISGWGALGVRLRTAPTCAALTQRPLPLLSPLAHTHTQHTKESAPRRRTFASSSCWSGRPAAPRSETSSASTSRWQCAARARLSWHLGRARGEDGCVWRGGESMCARPARAERWQAASHGARPPTHQPTATLRTPNRHTQRHPPHLPVLSAQALVLFHQLAHLRHKCSTAHCKSNQRCRLHGAPPVAAPPAHPAALHGGVDAAGL